MKDFSIDSQKQAQIMDKLKESLIAYTHKNKITVNAYIEDEEKKIEEAVKEKIIALDKNKEALLEKDKQITSLKREKEELRSSLKTELEKAHKTKLEHEDEIRSLKEDEIRSLKEDETKVNEMVMESKSSDTDQIEKLQNTLSDKEAAIHELKEEVNTLRSKLNTSSSFVDNHNVVKTPVSSPEIKFKKELKTFATPGTNTLLKSTLSSNVSNHNNLSPSINEYLIKKLNEEIADLKLQIKDEKEQNRKTVHVYESKISKLEESKSEMDQTFIEQQDHYWYGCGKCQRQVEDANRNLRTLERQYNKLLMGQR